MEGVSPSALLMRFFCSVLKDVLVDLQGSQTQVPFRVLDEKDGCIQERQNGLKIPYSRELFLKEVISWFSSKTSRVDISVAKNFHLQAQLLCELPVCQYLHCSLSVLWGRNRTPADFYNHLILQHL